MVSNIHTIVKQVVIYPLVSAQIVFSNFAHFCAKFGVREFLSKIEIVEGIDIIHKSRKVETWLKGKAKEGKTQELGKFFIFSKFLRLKNFSREIQFLPMSGNLVVLVGEECKIKTI